MLSIYRWVGIGVVLIFSACNSYTPKDQGGQANPNALSAQTTNFATIQSEIIKPNCVMCHSGTSGNQGGVNLETYASVKTFSSRIKDTIVKGTMPPGRPLAKNQQQALISWIDNGAPETVTLEAPSLEDEELNAADETQIK
jgi:uncharacterized membrane protein